MHFRSLRFKLTLWYVLILGILLISFSSFLYFTLSKSLYHDVDNKLRSLAELIAAESSSPLSKFGFGNTPLRIVPFPILENSHIAKIVQVASSLEDVEDALNTLLLILFITVPSILLIASLGGQFLANKALKPVDEISRTARSIPSPH